MKLISGEILWCVSDITLEPVNRPFATNDHMVQNPPCWRASSLLFPHWDIKKKGKSRLTGSGLFVLMSQWENNNELALQHGGFCTM